MKVKEVMKRPYVTEKDLSLDEAAKIMSSKNIGSLIYTEDDIVKGIITDGDLVKNYNSKKKISQILSKNVITVSPEDNMDVALKKMRKNGVKRLPVVQEDKIVGIITITDVMANAEELEDNFFFDD